MMDNESFIILCFLFRCIYISVSSFSKIFFANKRFCFSFTERLHEFPLFLLLLEQFPQVFIRFFSFAKVSFDFLTEFAIISLVATYILQKEVIEMRVILDLDSNMITVPKNFFKTIDKQNETIKKMGGEPIKATELIKKSFEVAMSDTDKYLRVKE